MYACGAFGRKLEIVQVRIGAPREIDASQFEGRVAEYKRDLGAYISARDLQQLVVRSIERGPLEDEWGVPFQIVYGVSNNTRAFWSIANARQVIGYAPEDDSELRYAADIARLLGQSAGRVGTRLRSRLWRPRVLSPTCGRSSWTPPTPASSPSSIASFSATRIVLATSRRQPARPTPTARSGWSSRPARHDADCLPAGTSLPASTWPADGVPQQLHLDM